MGAVAVGIDQNKKLKVFSGTNVEPTVHLDVCAERVAIYNGIAAGFKKFVAVVTSLPKAKIDISRMNNAEEIRKFTPCGACREVILQKVDHKGIIAIDGIERTFTPKELLPRPLLEINKLKTLTIDEMDALEKARKALHNSYVPLTRDKYGVSLLIENCDEIYSACTFDSTAIGCSVEPLKAVFGNYVAGGYRKNKIKAIVFAFPFVKYPPGDTLQLISDYCDSSTKIIIDNLGVTTIDELLPMAFTIPLEEM